MMQQQQQETKLNIKIHIPQMFQDEEQYKLELVGYRLDPHRQIGQSKEGSGRYGRDNVGGVIKIIEQEYKKTMQLYEGKDWKHLIRPLEAFTYQVQLAVRVTSHKNPSIATQSIENRPKTQYHQVLQLALNSLPQQKELTTLINSTADELINNVVSKTTKREKVTVSLAPKKIFNPHLFIKTNQKDKYIEYYTKGIYEYYHYGDQSFSDHGWGCAYRSLQTLLSWLNLQNHCKIPVIPTLTQIQQTIDTINLGSSQRLKGTRQWIGATEVSWVVKKISGYDCRILHISDGKDIIEHCEMFRQHFQKVGCPIMYGGGQYAYSIVGINYSWQLGECEFLILDPHYPGADSLDKILEKKGLAWRKPEDMFKKGIFYNFCLPLVPHQES